MRPFIVLVLLLTAGPDAFPQKTSYSLQQCIEQAWANLPQIRSLEQGNTISVEQLEQLRASVQPAVYFNASQNMNSGRSIDPFTYQFTNETIFSNNFSLNANVTLFSGLKYVRSKEQQSLLIEANKENIEKIKNDIALSIANQYLQVLLLKEQASALDTQIILSSRQYQREEKLIEAGKSNQNKVLQLKAQILTEENRRTDVYANVKSALIALKFACAIGDDLFDIASPNIDPVLNGLTAYTVETVMNEAEKNMASVQYARATEKYYLKGIDVSRAGYFPTLTLAGSVSSGYSSARTLNSLESTFSNQPIGYLFSNPSQLVYGPVFQNSVVQSSYSFPNQVRDNFAQFVGLNLRVPIFANRSNKTSVNIARINYEKSKIETENTLLSLRKDVETAVNSYDFSRLKKDKSNEIVQVQQQVLNNLNIYYQAGNTSLFELLTQKNMVQQADFTYIQAKYELVFRKLVLDYYSGKPIQL